MAIKQNKIITILKHFENTDPILFNVSKKVREPSILEKSNNLFVDLCETIISQQLSGKASDTIFRRFKKLFPEEKITAEFLHSLTEEKIRTVGTSTRKSYYLKNLAQKVITNELKLDIIHTFTYKEVISKLTKVKGIGPWTAEMFLMFSLAQEDIFSAGDLGLRNAIKKLYKLKKDPSKKQMEKLSKKWSPYRTYACLILWRSLEI